LHKFLEKERNIYYLLHEWLMYFLLNAKSVNIELISTMIFGALPNTFLCLFMKGLIMWFRVGMTYLGNCLIIYCSLLNFNLCIIWLLLIFLDSLNWILKDSSVLNQKFLLFPSCLWLGRNHLVKFHSLAKTLVFWKILHQCLPTDPDA